MKAESSRAPYYFQFHIGDYMRDAQELSLMQHGAYLALMLWYYSTGRPIPNDLERIYRRTGAMSREEKHAVEYVLGEFFRLEGKNWRHKRIDTELAAFFGKSDKSRDAANIRWEQAKLNKINETIDADAMQAQCERNANQEPRTINQNHKPPIVNTESNHTLSRYRDDARQILEFLNAKTGKAFRPTKTNLGFIQNRMKDGATVGDCKQVIVRMCRQWSQDDKMRQFLRPSTLFNRTNFDQYTGELVHDS